MFAKVCSCSRTCDLLTAASYRSRSAAEHIVAAASSERLYTALPSAICRLTAATDRICHLVLPCFVHRMLLRARRCQNVACRSSTAGKCCTQLVNLWLLNAYQFRLHDGSCSCQGLVGRGIIVCGRTTTRTPQHKCWSKSHCMDVPHPLVLHLCELHVNQSTQSVTTQGRMLHATADAGTMHRTAASGSPEGAEARRTRVMHWSGL